MNNQEIFELMDHFDASSATSFKLIQGDFTLELEKRPAAPAAPAPAGTAAAAPAVVPAAAAETLPVSEEKYITAPLVGTFYAAPSPDAPSFVAVGDRVKKGQTVCLLEAMKMMSEVQAPCDCIVEEVMPQNGALVSFGDPLIRYREG